LKDLFSSERNGIGLQFVRVPMGASDFTRGDFYTYDDVYPLDGLCIGFDDFDLSRFSIDRDRAYIHRRCNARPRSLARFDISINRVNSRFSI
jgi:O-glycosyl hydrolase